MICGVCLLTPARNAVLISTSPSAVAMPEDYLGQSRQEFTIGPGVSCPVRRQSEPHMG